MNSQNDCLFCRLYKEGDHVREADGFVAIKDINPRADVHLLVIFGRDQFGGVATHALGARVTKRLLRPPVDGSYPPGEIVRVDDVVGILE